MYDRVSINVYACQGNEQGHTVTDTLDTLTGPTPSSTIEASRGHATPALQLPAEAPGHAAVSTPRMPLPALVSRAAKSSRWPRAVPSSRASPVPVVKPV